MSGTPQDNGNGGAGPHAGADPHGRHVNAHTDADEGGNGTGAWGDDPYVTHGGSAPYGPYGGQAADPAYGQHVPRSWGGGEYDADATAFVQLPPGGFQDDVPLAAPGTGQGGYTPPAIDLSQTSADAPAGGTAGVPLPPAVGTDPASAGHWVLPFAGPESGYQDEAPGAGQQGAGQQSAGHGSVFGGEPAYGGESQAESHGAGHVPGGSAAAALAGSHEARTGRRPLGTGVAREDRAQDAPSASGPGDHPAAPSPSPSPSPSAAPPGPPSAEAAAADLGAGERSWVPSSPAPAPHWGEPGPGPMPSQEPAGPAGTAGTAVPGLPQEGEPVSAHPASHYAFPSAPSSERGGSQDPGVPEDSAPGHPGDDGSAAAPVPGLSPTIPAQAGPGSAEGTAGSDGSDGPPAQIVATEPPAPPAEPESRTDAEVTSLGAAAPEPQAPGQAPEPAVAQPVPAAGTEGQESGGDTAGGAAPQTDEIPGSRTDGGESEESGKIGQAGAREAPESEGRTGPAGTAAEPGAEGGPGAEGARAGGAGAGVSGAAETEAVVDAVPEAVETEDEHPHVSYVLHVNGVDRPVASAWIGESLLYVLRERLGLAGAKDGCAQGECGACSVQVDGRLVAACLVPAATAAGSEVRTVEGLSADGGPSDVQCALAESGSVQCGFCVPGLAMTVHDLLEGNHAPTDLETRKAISGNLCRCSGYRGVLDAVHTVVEQRAAKAEREAAEAEAAHAASREQTAAPGQDPHGQHPHGQHPPHTAYGQDAFQQGTYAHGPHDQGSYGQQHGDPGSHQDGPQQNGPQQNGPQQNGSYGQDAWGQGAYEQQHGAYEQGPHEQAPYEQGPPYEHGTYGDGGHLAPESGQQGAYGYDAYGPPQTEGYGYDPAAQIPHQNRHPGHPDHPAHGGGGS
ncbi:2Fe-2S iron-sulfur cluster-binding protein [Streptomyces reniochalinae]|uniref:2Fe-2S iron-sulfur cluster-binding protein n=1 Tax=Streptomyces reniochalinae TaxID=2250578 RepID=UPI001FEACAEC|nr:2Fe-2S iron-sulfur cluster-binding protein [Streptomyces reniochalinae]